MVFDDHAAARSAPSTDPSAAPSIVTSRFDRDTALTALGEGAYTGRMDPGWWIEAGPNGGYVAATILRGLTTTVDDTSRTPRSFTVHFLARPKEGEVRLETTVERTGRQLTFVGGRLSQDGKLLATTQAAFARPMSGIEFVDVQPPDIPPPEQLEAPPRPTSGLAAVAMRQRYDTRWAIGAAPFSGAPHAVAGGWIRLVEPRPTDHLLLAALTDAWMPPVFSRSTRRFDVPTIDLTVHFRSPIAPRADDDGWFLVVFRSQMAADGFVEEDGEVWSRDGRLLAHSRQLAVLLPA